MSSPTHLNGIERVFETSRALSGSRSLYDAYKHTRLINQKLDTKDGKHQDTPKTDPTAKGINLAQTATQEAANHTKSVAQQTTNIPDQPTSTPYSFKDKVAGRTAGDALNTIHQDLVQLNVTTEKVADNTAMLVRQSIMAMSQTNATNANSLARMNEGNESQVSGGERLEPSTTVPTAKKDDSVGEDIAKAGIGSWLASKFLKKGALGFASRGLGMLGGGLGLASLAPLVVPLITIGGGVLLAKEALEALLNMPDEGTRDIFKSLLDKKAISWLKDPKIENVSYLKTLPKEKIKLLIDSGKFQGGQLGTLKQILKEPITKTRVPATIPEPKAKIRPFAEPKQTDLKISSIKNENQKAVIAPDLQTQFTPPNEFGFNTEEKNPEINIPIEKSKNNLSLNIESVEIESLLVKEFTIEQLILGKGDNYGTGMGGTPPNEEHQGTTESGNPITRYKGSKAGIPENGYNKVIPEEGNDKSTLEEGNNKLTPEESTQKVAELISHKELTRNDRTNNPGMLRYTPTSRDEYGAIGGDRNAQDGPMAVFATKEAGSAALDANLHKYNKKYGLSTIRGIIEKWAPPNENDTEAYISKELNVGPNDKLDMDDPKVIAALGKNIAKVEGKGSYIPADKRGDNGTAKKEPDIKKDETASLEKPKESGSGDNGTAKKEPDIKKDQTASLEKPKESGSGDIIAQAKNAESPIKKEPNLSEDNLKRIADNQVNHKPTIIQQAPQQPTQAPQKPQNMPIIPVRNDDSILHSIIADNMKHSVA